MRASQALVDAVVSSSFRNRRGIGFRRPRLHQQLNEPPSNNGLSFPGHQVTRMVGGSTIG